MASKSAYQDEWKSRNVRRFVLGLSRISEADMIEWLEGKESMQGYIKHLIRADMARAAGGCGDVSEGIASEAVGQLDRTELRKMIREEISEILQGN